MLIGFVGRKPECRQRQIHFYDAFGQYLDEAAI